MVKTRQSNIELLRIICMILIVTGHIIKVHGRTSDLSDGDEIIKLIGISFTSVATNTFVLISGYFGLNFKIERLIRLVFQTLFYSLVLLSISIIIGWHSFDLKKDIFALFPILTKQYWFVTCYIILYVISPWLNLSIKHMDKKMYLQSLIIGFVIIYLWPTFSYLFNTAQFIGDSGYGIVNFSFLYILGRYLNLHHVQKHSSSFYFNLYFICCISLFICQYSLSWILGFEFTSWISYNTVFILFGALCLFEAFRNVKLQSNIINYFAKPCLAVYLIHLNPYIWNSFCKSIGVSNYHGFHYVLLLLSLPIIIYVTCAIIDLCRIKITNKLEETIISFLHTTSKKVMKINKKATNISFYSDGNDMP